MKALIGCAVLLAVLATPAMAGSRYDRKLEEAVLGIVAAKMGDLRAGFAYDAKPQIIAGEDSMFTGSIGIETARQATPAPEPERITKADERKVSRVIAY